MKKTHTLKEQYGLNFKQEILHDKRLSPTHRLTLAFIIAWDNEEGCFATNNKLAYVVGCSDSKISRVIHDLIKFDYIRYNFSRNGHSNVRKVRSDLKIKISK